MTKSGIERAAVQKSISFSPNVSVASQGGSLVLPHSARLVPALVAKLNLIMVKNLIE